MGGITTYGGWADDIHLSLRARFDPCRLNIIAAVNVKKSMVLKAKEDIE
jgi:hypothetical protein